GPAHLRHPEPARREVPLPHCELYLAIVALHHRDGSSRGIGLVRVGRDASSQTPQGTPRKSAALTNSEKSRLREFRRLAALFRLTLLFPDGQLTVVTLLGRCR